MTEYDKDNIIMNVLHTVGFSISLYQGLMIMLEDGMAQKKAHFLNNSRKEQ